MITIKQIYYDQNQVSLLDEGAVPFLNNGKAPPAEREFGVMKACYQANELFRGETQYEGFISWKFSEKARIPLKNFISAIEENPGFDVYILNPFPHQVLYRNVWHQGEAHHPGVLAMAQELVHKAGLDWNLSASPNIVSHVSYCNFWVGSPQFWDLYMRYGVALYNALMTDASLRERFFKPAPGGNVEAPYFAFFFERLITEVLIHHPEIRGKSFRYPLEWMKQNFRADVAQFLSEIPWDQDLNRVPESAQVQHYLGELRNSSDFYGGEYFGNPLLRFIKGQKFLKELLRNSVTTRVYRSLLKKSSGQAATGEGMRLL